MTIPHAYHQLQAFAPNWLEPVNTATQVDRMPGTASAPCLCIPPRIKCGWPMCPWKPPEKEDK